MIGRRTFVAAILRHALKLRYWIATGAIGGGIAAGNVSPQPSSIALNHIPAVVVRGMEEDASGVLAAGVGEVRRQPLRQDLLRVRRPTRKVVRTGAR